MSHWETQGQSDDWFTPKYIFDALDCRFDLDVACPENRAFISVPAERFISKDSLNLTWTGFVWMNPPFGGRNGISPWLNKIYDHGNGIALTPDRTSAPWWQNAAKNSNGAFFIKGKVKFVRPDGSRGDSPSSGTTLFAFGELAVSALTRAEINGLGKFLR